MWNLPNLSLEVSIQLFFFPFLLLNKSWRQHPTKKQLCGHISPITKTIQVRRTRHAEHCWRSKDELISYILLWTPSHGRAKAGWPARTYIQQLCADTGYSLEDLPGAMNDRHGWRERAREIHAGTVTWWWWWLFCCFTVCSHADFAVSLSFLFFVYFTKSTQSSMLASPFPLLVLLLHLFLDTYCRFVVS